MIPTYRSIEEIPATLGPTVASIGNFDGVHVGHRLILSVAVEEARALGIRAIAITFDPHPEQFLRPAQAPLLLTPVTERLRLLATTGIDAVVILPFNEALARLTAREFVQQILVDKLQIHSLHEGGNFRFGLHAAAGVNELREFGAEFGFSVHIHSPVSVRAGEVSSSAIRALLTAGNLSRARQMLGRSFAVRSTPARGRGIGTRLLVPTVNLAPYDGLLPAFGVYVTHLMVGERRFQAVTNIGNRPTFGQDSFAVESHILDFEPVDLNENTPLELEFLLRLRPEIVWPNPEALKAQIYKDVAKAKKFFQRISPQPLSS
jgi:riboflavin kinase/FMN adenylyltransferase